MVLIIISIIRMIKSKKMMWASHVACMGEEKRDANKVLVRKPEGKRPVGRPRYRVENNSKMDFK
jgi:hypothetical protein